MTVAELRKLIEEGGRLVPKCEKHWKEINRLKQIKHLISVYAEQELLDFEETVYHGRRYEAKVSARTFEREITDLPGVMEAIGAEQFLKHAELALEKLDVLLPDARERGLLKREQTGPRRVRIVPKQPALKAAA